MSAWCLGVLNSHRKFFLSYTAPVVWNLAIIAALIFFGHHRRLIGAIGPIPISPGNSNRLGLSSW